MDRRFPAGLGSINFDNIINAVLAIFQMMTLEGWADLCYSIQDSVGMAHWVYFMVLILIGPYLSVQLFLVVLSANCSSMASEHVSYDVQQ
jgi:voltage-dependent calcium channel L type alpha-1D